MYYRSKNRPQQAQEQEQSDKKVDSGISIELLVVICVIAFLIFVIFGVMSYLSTRDAGSVLRPTSSVRE